jgi:hypothetical protein
MIVLPCTHTKIRAHKKIRQIVNLLTQNYISEHGKCKKSQVKPVPRGSTPTSSKEECWRCTGRLDNQEGDGGSTEYACERIPVHMAINRLIGLYLGIVDFLYAISLQALEQTLEVYI